MRRRTEQSKEKSGEAKLERFLKQLKEASVWGTANYTTHTGQQPAYCHSLEGWAREKRPRPRLRQQPPVRRPNIAQLCHELAETEAEAEAEAALLTGASNCSRNASGVAAAGAGNGAALIS